MNTTLITEADDPSFQQGESLFLEDGIILHGEDGEDIIFIETDDNPKVAPFNTLMAEGGLNAFHLEDGLEYLELESA